MSKTYDVCIVGAGPAGSVCAFYLARQGKSVLLLDKKAFPRDKICGDAVVPRAQWHLREMGVMQELVDNNECTFAVAGGFVSPGGIECIGSSATNVNGLVIAVKRIHMDARCAWAARRAGAELVEGVNVTSAEMDRNGTWTIRASSQSFRARVLVAADGSHSRLAKSLGVVEGHPTGICSRAYIEGGTHKFPYDGGVVYMPRALLPGYAAIFTHPNQELGYCCYVIPGGSTRPEDLDRMHHELLATHPVLRRHLGDGYKIEKRKGAWLRLGGVPQSYARNLLVIGDAAGHIDPLTGEGIHLAMDGAREAAETLREAFAAGDFGVDMMRRYHDRWMRVFGHEFKVATYAARMMHRFPRAVDAMAGATVELGTDFFKNWADVMTGSGSWSMFLKPSVFVPILKQMVRPTVQVAANA
jgi:geranylgeranyl reductase family protein